MIIMIWLATQEMTSTNESKSVSEEDDDGVNDFLCRFDSICRSAKTENKRITPCNRSNTDQIQKSSRSDNVWREEGKLNSIQILFDTLLKNYFYKLLTYYIWSVYHYRDPLILLQTIYILLSSLDSSLVCALITKDRFLFIITRLKKIQKLYRIHHHASFNHSIHILPQD